jgi:hypothetical protein
MYPLAIASAAIGLAVSLGVAYHEWDYRPDHAFRPGVSGVLVALLLAGGGWVPRRIARGLGEIPGSKARGGPKYPASSAFGMSSERSNKGRIKLKEIADSPPERQKVGGKSRAAMEMGRMNEALRERRAARRESG